MTPKQWSLEGIGMTDRDQEKALRKEQKAKDKAAKALTNQKLREAREKNAAAQKAAEAKAKAKAEAEALNTYGQLISSGMIGFDKIAIFAKGYVSFGKMFTSPTPVKLLGISSNLNTKKKNVVGRSAGFLLTGGMNTMFTSKNKGLAYLTVITSAGSKTFRSESPTDSDIKSIMQLEAAGQSVLASQETVVEVKQVVSSSSMADELAKLAELKKSGALTAAEYTAAKKKLLG